DGQEIEMVGVDCSIIMNPRVWEASGHVGGFQDPMQTCRQCKKLFRADQVPTMLQESEWVQNLWLTFPPTPQGTFSWDSERLKQWAKKGGKRLAPGLALVRNPETA